MERLTRRAQAMLARGRRHPHPTSREDIVACIERSNLPVFEPVVRFEEEFGGFEYFIRGDEYYVRGRTTSVFVRPGVRLGLLDESWRVYLSSEGAKAPVVDGDCRSGCYVFTAGCHNFSTPFEFALDQDGTWLVVNQNGIIPIAASIESFLEGESVKDSLVDLAPEWVVLGRGNLDPEDRRIDERIPFLAIPEASDRYHRWWGNDRIFISRRPFWDWPILDSVIVYTRSVDDARALSGEFRDVFGADGPTIGRWPRTPYVPPSSAV
jgi:hypothetical protein